MYLHQRKNWTDFRWDNNKVTSILDKVVVAQKRLSGRMSEVPLDIQLDARVNNLSRNVISSSAIEGVHLNFDEVHPSIAESLGFQGIDQTTGDKYVYGVVSVQIEALNHYEQKLTKEKICLWQTALFPPHNTEGSSIEVGKYRTNEEVVASGTLGRERVHYVAPSPDRLQVEMKRFLDWFNGPVEYSDLIRSALAHFWFVSIHPFEDGNGRISRILADMLIARNDQSGSHFYNITSEILRHKGHYYKLLERLQKGDGELTEWICWYLDLLYDAIIRAEYYLNSVLAKTIFWQRAKGIPLNQRQREIINRFLDGYEAKITPKTWAQLAKCSTEYALQDIKDLYDKDLLMIDIPGIKRPSYSLRFVNIANETLTEIARGFMIENQMLKGVINGITYSLPVSELDADRYARVNLPMISIVQKYCAHILCKYKG